MAQASAQVLRNIGVPVKVAEVVLDVYEDQRVVVDEVTGVPSMATKYLHRWVQVLDDNKEPVVREKWVKFNNNTLAALEDKYGSMQGFQEEAAKRTNDATRVAIAAAWGYRPDDDEAIQKVGAMFLDTETGMYTTAVTIAMAIANGVDPTQAARMLEEGRIEIRNGMKNANAEIDKMLEESRIEREEAEAKEAETDDTPGTNGSSTGPESDEPTPSSGS